MIGLVTVKGLTKYAFPAAPNLGPCPRRHTFQAKVLYGPMLACARRTETAHRRDYFL